MKLTIHEKGNALRDALVSVEGNGGGWSNEWDRQVARCTFNGRRDELRAWVIKNFLPAQALVNKENKFEIDRAVQVGQ